MPIRYLHSIDVPQSPELVFSVLDDLPRTPQWLAPCVNLETLSPGPNAVGNKLRYSFREGKRVGVMDGEIRARTPNEHLNCHYQDAMFEVSVDFRTSPSGTGTRLVHTIEMTPKTWFGKLLSPLVRMGVPRQTINAMESLRSLLASEGATPVQTA